MFLISWILTAFFIAIAFSARISENDPGHSSQNIWAVLVAGSHRWLRYRHQSNVCHAYKILRENGIPKERIITFMYDDIAYNSENPEPGVIRNEPNGINVYEGVPIDYTGENVRKDVFLNVLRGYKMKVKGIGSERVVLSTNKDNILIFHTGLGGHGGQIEFPNSGEDVMLHGDELVRTFKQMYNRNGYKHLLMYLESSHSGAMFENSTLPHNINVLAITAGGPDEDTYGTFCDTSIEPCLAGLFSYAWMNYAENNPDGLRKSQSVFDHFDHVRDDVANTAKEHPQLYGDWNIGKLPISQFIGYQNRNSSSSKTTKTELVGDVSGGHSAYDKDSIIAEVEVPVEQNVNRRFSQ
ncbi:legumain-like [Myzus persicae]|uniref:legumain-like n=1 Tax=Myzus persicae TaxID=13164 RepID=UPI000B937585|nr:legumain-like [Myzus persicae]